MLVILLFFFLFAFLPEHFISDKPGGLRSAVVVGRIVFSLRPIRSCAGDKLVGSSGMFR